MCTVNLRLFVSHTPTTSQKKIAHTHTKRHNTHTQSFAACCRRRRRHPFAHTAVFLHLRHCKRAIFHMYTFDCVSGKLTPAHTSKTRAVSLPLMLCTVTLLFPLLLALLFPTPSVPFTCLDASGSPVDWFVAIKYPAANVPPGNYYTITYATAPGVLVNTRCTVACRRSAFFDIFPALTSCV